MGNNTCFRGPCLCLGKRKTRDEKGFPQLATAKAPRLSPLTPWTSQLCTTVYYSHSIKMCLCLSFPWSSFLKTYIKYFPKIMYFSLMNLYFCRGTPATNPEKAGKVAPSSAHFHTSVARPWVSEPTELKTNIPKKAEKRRKGRAQSVLSVYVLEEHRAQYSEGPIIVLRILELQSQCKLSGLTLLPHRVLRTRGTGKSW